MNRLTPIALLGLLGLATATAQRLPGRKADIIPAQANLIYEKGLTYLASAQNERGAWNDSNGSEPGVVGLCVKAFLGTGQDVMHGPYANNIQKAVSFIISQQNDENGYIGSSMYNHAFATLALAEVYGMIDDPKVAPALKKAVELILNAQKRSRSGGWRYTPTSRDADTTVTGCNLVALYAAQNAGIAVPKEAFRKALSYLNSKRGSNGSYGYTSSSGGRPTLTAIGVMCFSLAKQKDTKGYQSSTEYLRKHLDYRDRHYPYYFEYYMSQALFHADEELWRDWNQRNLRYLGTIQSPNGSFLGNHGSAFCTTGALLSIALNYRFLPIYEK